MIFFQGCKIIARAKTTRGNNASWTGPGFLRLTEHINLIFTVSYVPRTMLYDIFLRYETHLGRHWNVARINVLRPKQPELKDLCRDKIDGEIAFRLFGNETIAPILNAVCLQRGETYRIKLSFDRQHSILANPDAYILIDSLVLMPHIASATRLIGAENIPGECRRIYHHINYDASASLACKQLFRSMALSIFGGALPCRCDPKRATNCKEIVEYFDGTTSACNE